MARLPAYVRITMAGYGEDFDPSVERTEMERGMPRQRLINSDVLMQVMVNLIFERKEYCEMFDTWYFEEIERIGFFEFRHPRTKQMLNVRFVDGKIGPLVPIKGGFGLTTRQCTVEYLR